MNQLGILGSHGRLDVFVLHCTAVERYFRAKIWIYELLQVQEFWDRAHQHGPCCFTRAPVLIHWMGEKKCVSRHISTRAVLIHTGTRVDPLYWQNNAFSGHISTRAVLIYTGTRVKPPVLVFKLCFLCMLLSTD